MKILPYLSTDIDEIADLNPTGWADIQPYFRQYGAWENAFPLKMMDGQRIVALGTTIVHQDSVWLAHIIVHPDYRNQGLGQKMTQALVDSVPKQTCKTVLLIATELGFPVYQKLGFAIDGQYAMLRTEATQFNFATAPEIVPFQPQYEDSILQMDARVSGENRHYILQQFIQDAQVLLEHGQVKGAYFPTLVDGLILADSDEAGLELMKMRLNNKNNASFPIENQAAIDFLHANQFTTGLTPYRMYLGEKRTWQPANIYNRISGGLG